jgi:hypothetical protein
VFQFQIRCKKAAKLRDKQSFKKIWQFGKSNSSGASTSASPAPATDPEARQPQPPPSPRHDQQQTKEITAEAQHAETNCDELGDVRPADVASKAGAGASAAEAAAAAPARPTVTTPTAWIARSKEDIAATRIQAACRGYLVTASSFRLIKI